MAMMPPTRGKPTDPSMAGGSTSDMIRSQVGGPPQGQAPGAGPGGGSPQQAAQLIASGASQLMQAAQMFPALAEPIQQAIAILQAGVGQIAQAGRGAGPGNRPPTGKSSAKSRPKVPDEQVPMGQEGSM